MNAKSLEQLLAEGQGYKTGSAPFVCSPGSILCTTSVLRGMLVPVRKGVVYTGAVICLTTNGATLSLSKLAVYSTSGATRHAVTADFSSSITSGATKMVAVDFASTFTPAADGVVYVASVFVGTTGPTLTRSITAGNFDTHIGAGVKTSVAQTSTTDANTTATWANDDARCHWIGLY